MKKIFIFVFMGTIISMYSCKSEKSKESGLIENDHNIKIQIMRYEQALFSLNPEKLGHGLSLLDKDFYIFIQGNYHDTVRLMDLRSFILDTNMVNIYKACQEVFPDLKDLEKEFSEAFGYVKYYFPDFRLPRKMYTYVSGINFEQPVDYLDSIILIGLDNYLGQDYIYYKWYRIPQYRIEKMAKEFIVPDCMFQIARSKTAYRSSNNTLLDRMIYEGKLLYFLDLMLPGTRDIYKIGYTSEQLSWCDKFQKEIWSFFLKEDLLYTTEKPVINKFINEGPFTGAISKESPSKLGTWVGWQIVRKYVEENPEISLNELLMQNDAQLILRKSRYKPRK